MHRPLAVLILLLLAPGRSPAYDPEVWTTYPNMNFVSSIAEGDDEVYFATTGGIRRYDRFGRRWLAPLTALDGLPDGRVERLAYERSSGDLWFDTPMGSGSWLTRLHTVSRASPPSGVFASRGISGFPSVFPPYGYYLQDGRVLGPSRSYAITDALTDSWRILWLGTWGLGVGRADLTDEQLQFHPYGPICPNVTAIARDGHGVWFGGDEGRGSRAEGITFLDEEEGAWRYFGDDDPGLDDVRVSSILPEGGDVWFGTPTGLVRYLKRPGQWLTYRIGRSRRARITSLARDGDRLWIGTEAGLKVFDTKGDSLRAVEGSSRFPVRAMAVGDSLIWAGTELGLYRCVRGEGTWTRAPGPEGLTRLPVAALCTRAGGVWAVLRSPPALVRISDDGSEWERFPLSEITGSRSVSVAADTSRVWVTTDQGVFRLRLSSGLWQRYIQYDGLLADRVNAVLLDGDFVWFGTS
ncbi:MAG: hypothetical protein QGI83_02045, partial [Candidatus Latescibacteria bacterium]|nr:hypothetical protein [Candidatus Latescibacterota bacterium]